MKRYQEILNKKASTWKRGLAYLIDLVIINFVIVTPFQAVLKQGTLNSLSLESLFVMNSKEMLIASIMIAVLSIIYWTTLEYKLGQSVGKIFFHLKVKSKRKLTFKQALVRNLSKPFFFLLLVDIIYLGFNANKQRLFEKWSKTWVTQE